MQEVSGVTNHKPNQIISICSRFIVFFSDLGFLCPGGVGQVGRGYVWWPTIVYISSGLFRGKESLNTIKLSWLVQDLLNFGDLGYLLLWGVWVGRVAGWMGLWSDWWYPHTPISTNPIHLKFMQISPPMGSCIVWWMGGLMGGGHVKS